MIELREYTLYNGEMPSNLLECDHWIFSGSTCAVYQKDPSRPWIAKLHQVTLLCYGLIQGTTNHISHKWRVSCVWRQFMAELIDHPDPNGPRAIGVCYGHQVSPLKVECAPHFHMV